MRIEAFTLPLAVALAVTHAFLLWKPSGRLPTDRLSRVTIGLGAVLSALVLYGALRTFSSSSLWPLFLSVGSLGPMVFYVFGVVLFALDKSASTKYSSGPRSQKIPYRALEEDQIRLLKFLPLPTGDETLRFELFHAKLSQMPHYLALSYSWGCGKADKVPISVDGREVDISPQLAEALHRVREHYAAGDAADDDVVVWVDAICINQADVVEKGKEVTRMFTIYRVAVAVVIWLGADAGSEATMAPLVATTEQHDRTVSAALPSRPQTPDAPNLPGVRNAVNQLLSQEYWTRVWIIQEVSAARNARLFWGSYSLDLRLLEMMVREDPEPQSSYRTNNRNVSGLARQVLQVRSICRARQKPRLMEILAMTSASETSVLRDKVYGLLGLASDRSDFVQAPNYQEGISERTLCLEMTSNYINWYASADIIFLKSTSSYQRTLPSWCPDYFHFQVHEYDKNLIPYSGGRDVNLGWERWRAFGEAGQMADTTPEAFEIHGDHLKLKGSLIGRISALGAIQGENSGSCRFLPHISSLVRNIPDVGRALRRLLLLCDSHTFGNSRGEDFFDLLYNLPYSYYAQKGVAISEWLELNQTLLQTFGLSQRGLSGDAASPMTVTELNIPGPLDGFSVRPEWREYFGLRDSAIATANSTRRSRQRTVPLDGLMDSISTVLAEHLRLMCVGEEPILGWVHRDAQLNDTVWHLEGCTLQAVLRKSAELSQKFGHDVYQLVGHASVDPVMASGRWIAREGKGRRVHIC